MAHYSDKQLALEKKMAELGVSRYRSRLAKARAKNRETTTATGRYLLRESVSKMAAAIQEWKKSARRSAGPHHAVVNSLDSVSNGVAALIAVKAVLDSATFRMKLTRAAYFIGSAIEDELRAGELVDQAKPLWYQIEKETKGKGSKAKRRHVRDIFCRTNFNLTDWPHQRKIRLGAVLLQLLEHSTGLIKVEQQPAIGPKRRKRSFDTYVLIAPDALEWIERSNEAHEALFPMYLPSYDVPGDWETLFDGGYRTNLVYRRPLVKTHDKAHMAELAQADMPEVFDAVNALQKTAWELNPLVYAVAEHCWEQGISVAELPSRIDEPLPTVPLDMNTNPEAKAAWKKKASLVYRNRAALRSQRLQTAKILFMAKQFDGEKFYFPYQADFRGRLYQVPFYLHPQGNELARGLLRFAEGKPISDAVHARWLAIHGANCYGYDKVSLDARVDWVHAHKVQIAEVYQDPLENRWWAQADKPWEFLAFCLEWGEFLEDGYGVMSHIPIAMDGSNNGLQIFSLLLRDQAGAEATNCAPCEVPRDIYQDVADKVTQKLMGSSDPNAPIWLAITAGRLPRAATKRPVMTLPYGATAFSCLHYVAEWYETLPEATTAVWPKHSWSACQYLAGLVWEAIGETVACARECMAWLQKAALLLHKYDMPVRWTTPTGFIVRQAYLKTRGRQLRTKFGDSTRWVRYREDTDALNAKQQRNGIAANFIHSLDASALVKTVNAAFTRGVTSMSMIHDSYATHCTDAETLSRVLREQYAEMFSDNLLERFRSEIQLYLGDRDTVQPVPAMGSFNVADVVNSTYFFA